MRDFTVVPKPFYSVQPHFFMGNERAVAVLDDEGRWSLLEDFGASDKALY